MISEDPSVDKSRTGGRDFSFSILSCRRSSRFEVEKEIPSMILRIEIKLCFLTKIIKITSLDNPDAFVMRLMTQAAGAPAVDGGCLACTGSAGIFPLSPSGFSK